MTHAREKSDLAIVAAKPTNKAEQSVAEPVEPRAGTKGNANQQSTHRAQYRTCVAQELVRMRRAARPSHRHSPRWEPYALIGPVRICAGGAQ